MSEKVIKLVKKHDITSKVQTLRASAIEHSKAAKRLKCISGVFVSRSPDGNVRMDSWGCNDFYEEVGLLEVAKQISLKGIDE